LTQERQITTQYNRDMGLTNKRIHVNSFCHIRQILFSLAVSKNIIRSADNESSSSVQTSK